MAPAETPERADPITRHIAERVQTLRKSRGWSQAELAERMSKLRPNWSRSTVVKFENFKRQDLSVAELLALAVVLDVPPPMLIADPRLREPVPITDDLYETPWNALQWMVGIKKLAEPDPNASEIIWAAWEIYDATVRLRNPAAVYIGHDAESIRQADAQAHREQLYRVERAFSVLRRHRVDPPPLHAAVLRRAKELGFDDFPAEG